MRPASRVFNPHRKEHHRGQANAEEGPKPNGPQNNLRRARDRGAADYLAVSGVVLIAMLIALDALLCGTSHNPVR
jgi:hypothetical protein